jgi:hypothetical protein
LHADHDAQAVPGRGLLGVRRAVRDQLVAAQLPDRQLRREDGVSLDVGFYYMANALGRLLGTLLSGWVFQVAGLAACLADLGGVRGAGSAHLAGAAAA